MSENTNRITPADIDAMSTADLEFFLQMDMLLPDEKQSDAETLMLIMEALDQRKDAEISVPISTEEAFEKFQRLYLPNSDEVQSCQEGTKKSARLPRWLRVVAAAAAVAVVLITGSLTVKSAGFDLWGFVVECTDELFFFADPNAEEVPVRLAEFDEVQSIFDSYDVKLQLVPSRLPKGYVLETVHSSETPKSIDILAQFVKEDDRIFMLYTYHRMNAVPYLTEKDKQEMVEYVSGGQTHYLLINIDNVVAKWIAGNWECSFFGPVTEEEMKQIIASIYEGE